jgi:arginine exporter protein ArgO
MLQEIVLRLCMTLIIGLFALGVFVGSLVWQFGLVFAATITSKFTNHKVQQEIQYSGALLILVLAIVLILW